MNVNGILDRHKKMQLQKKKTVNYSVSFCVADPPVPDVDFEGF